MKSLDIAFLRALLAIADHGTVARAAQLVPRTPAAVSQQMQRLEATLGRPLFLRRGTRLQLTAAGEQLVRHARQLVALNDRAIAEITGEPAAEQVRFGMPQDFAETVLVEALRDFRSTHLRWAWRRWWTATRCWPACCRRAGWTWPSRSA